MAFDGAADAELARVGAAAPGITIYSSSARQVATATLQAPDATFWGFGWPGLFRLEPLPLSCRKV